MNIYEKIVTAVVLVILAVVVILATTPTVEAGTAKFDSSRSALVLVGSTDRKLRYLTLRKLKEHKGEIEYIEMSGPGGSMADMIVLMNAVRDSNLPVVIPAGTACASACAMVAISSKNIIVNGTMMFHMGYRGGYGMNTSLHDILKQGQGMTVAISPEIAKIGFKHHFLKLLVRWTGPDKWYVVTKASQLNDCRMKGDSVKEYYSSCYMSAPRLTTAEARYYTLKQSVE